ncbi:MAG TPA: hypothetical protein PLU35_12590, partial [Phycisphaerales bacterium]|nr:hypothetical protein [Phycisphaerales bacterium]
MKDRIRDLLAHAVLLPQAERSRFLERECTGDEALLAEVRSLLEAIESAGGFLASPTSPPFESPTSASPLSGTIGSSNQPGDLIGRYKLLQVIGEGG